MVGALEDMSETGEDPPFVRLKSLYFECHKVRLPLDQEDSGQMATFYDQPESKGQFCSLDTGELEMNETVVPKLALIPSKIAVDAFEVGRGNQGAKTSKLAYVLTPNTICGSVGPTDA